MTSSRIRLFISIISMLALLLLSSRIPSAFAAFPAECELPTSGWIKFSKCIPAGTNPDVVIGGDSGTGDCKGGPFNVYEDVASVGVGKVTINKGSVLKLFDRTAQLPVNMTTTGFDVFGNLEIGDVKCPIGTINANTRVTILFQGSKPADCGKLNEPDKACAGYVKGIQVEKGALGKRDGGTLRMYGTKGVVPATAIGTTFPSWTYLSQPAGDPAKYSSANGVRKPPPVKANIKTIYTADRVDTGTGAWKSKDWIAIATTSFSPWETEFAQINTIGQDTDNPGATGSKITLINNLAYYHFGSADPGDPSTDANYKAGAVKNYGVDERAEVGLISRNIVLTSDSDVAPTTAHWGGELKFLMDFKAVALQGVEIQKFGKEQLGSYPIHFHMDGNLDKYDAADRLVDSNSIDHSYNKCVTVHSTSHLIVSNNVCARVTGHIFYEEVGNEQNIAFKGNVGMGAMSNSFDVNATGDSGTETRDSLITNYYWKGDNMFTPPGVSTTVATRIFDQFKIFDADNQYVQTGSPIPFTTTRGTCGYFSNLGQYISSGPPGTGVTCYPTNTDVSKRVYFEPPSGFWILNPSAKIIGNSIAGCQDTGSAYWYAPPPDPNPNAVKFIPIGPSTLYSHPRGQFTSNRAHGCYRGLIDDQFELSTADSIFGYQNGVKSAQNHPVIEEFDKFTVTRSRDRAIWLRPVFYFLKDARMAMNRRSISFVTSGGADGNYPGVWSLLSHSTMVGISENNVDRFGPCGSKVIVNGKGWVRGAERGCIDLTVPTSGTATGGEFLERGYDSPDWNMFGFMSYDGPPLIITDRFVNFLKDPKPLLTSTDKSVLDSWVFLNAYKHYEGDAAIGWLDSNQSAYPTAAASKNLTFTNTTLRHQVYTDLVNEAAFNDGDKNTSIIDFDGTLSGYDVGNSSGVKLEGAHPISLNNLPFNAASNSVDECKAIGQQNEDLEGRDTAAMVPTGVGQLEVESLYPDLNKPFPEHDHSQLLTFYKNTLDFKQHGDMSLHSRNGLGIWEPKVSSGYGYVVRADPYNYPGIGLTPAGIPKLLDVSLVDTVKPGISSSNPFYVQLGICYSDATGMHPTSASKFTVTRGYKSWGGGGFEPSDSELRKYFNQLIGLTSSKQFCHNLDSQNAQNIGNANFDGCPTEGVALKTGATCPDGSTAFTDRLGGSSCKFPTSAPSPVASLSKMTQDETPNGKPNLNTFFYDPGTGMLYLWVYQDRVNAVGPSPLGNCTGADSDPAFCPENTGSTALSTGEAYYNCPAEGCPTYRVVLNDDSYTPGTSTCPVFGGDGKPNSWLTGTDGATWPAPPANEPTLIYQNTSNKVVRSTPVPSPLPHYAPGSEPTCAVTTSN